MDDLVISKINLYMRPVMYMVRIEQIREYTKLIHQINDKIDYIIEFSLYI